MIKYTTVPKLGKTIAKMDNCENDVQNLLLKKTGYYFPLGVVGIRPAYKASVKCYEEDEYSEIEGKKEARKKLIAKYNKSYNKALDSAVREAEEMYLSLKAAAEKHRR